MNTKSGNTITAFFTTSITVMLLAFTSAAYSDSANETESKLRQTLNGDHRSDGFKARDQYRHPVETLSFFGIKDDMSVVEIFPGGGWYTEILAPFLKEKGTFYVAGNNPGSTKKWARNSATRFKEKMQSNPVYDNVKLTVLEPPANTEVAPAGSADMVLTFRNIHNWMKGGYADDVFAAMYKALKPSGILGVVEHRGKPTTKQDPEARSGYVNQDYTIKLAEKAGFKFVASSEINANPKDTKDHPKGVWTLPPSFAKKGKDQQKYMAIGESDRMTLKFVKP